MINSSTHLFPYTTLFRSGAVAFGADASTGGGAASLMVIHLVGQWIGGLRSGGVVQQVVPVRAFFHLLARGAVDGWLGGVPATAERFVQGNQVAHGIAAADQVVVLLRSE